ncbi:class I SAM-dependent methyltransferase [Alkalimonas sp.]|uniref:class I SAM-dependent methyltransferase n=1 Tax=Alkalimonas sp. TaxID=1872453 RepID=UPI00263B03A8|nr:class I SAM-dependent methyltransferase [Alkalimonas sp.]MCC5825604.1 class I SAM-dependent methyltransferase [Alkalimonas sp.]
MIVLPGSVLSAADQAYLDGLSQRFGLILTEQAEGWHLAWHLQALVLRHTDLLKQSDIVVDFASGSASYRRQHGGGMGEAIAKAVGLNKKRDLTVIDATAGLGRDAFVLASLGAKLTLVERNPLVAALLADGLRRASEHPDLSDWLPERMQLHFAPAQQALSQLDTVEVVYLDPMFPERQKSALVKKEMRAFHQVVGEDPDADALLPAALALASKRVVVKRPAYAPPLAGTKPSHEVKGKNNRFDVYVKAAI